MVAVLRLALRACNVIVATSRCAPTLVAGCRAIERKKLENRRRCGACPLMARGWVRAQDADQALLSKRGVIRACSLNWNNMILLAVRRLCSRSDGERTKPFGVGLRHAARHVAAA